MERKFQYKDLDLEGLETLSVIEKADKFNRWMFNTIRPFCKGKVLEIGSGTGNISAFFIEEKFEITLSDIRENYCGYLENKFQDKAPILCMDLTDNNFDVKFKDQLGQYDTVFALNVVEHIEDHELALANCKKLLAKGGRLIILVPAFQSLYNRFDEELYHFRRYTKKTLKDIFIKNDFKIIHSQYFNFAGILGWYLSGKIQKNKTIPKGQMSLYNNLVPLFKIADAVLSPFAGLSVVMVGEK